MTGNKQVLSETLDWAELFKHDYWGTPLTDPNSHKSFRPVTVASFWLNRQWGGLDPYGFHATNIALHVANAFLVAVVSSLCFPEGRRFRVAALLSGVVFSVHPMHSEAVSNITNRAELLSLFFQLLAFVAYAGTGWRQSIRLSFVSVLTVLSMLSKESGVMIMPLLIAYELVSSGAIQYFSAKLASAAFSKSKHHQHGTSVPEIPGSLVKRVGSLLGVVLLLVYLRLKWQVSAPDWYGVTNPAANAEYFTTRFLTFAYLDWFHLRLLLWPNVYCPDWRNTIDLVESVCFDGIRCRPTYLVYCTTHLTYQHSSPTRVPG